MDRSGVRNHCHGLLLTAIVMIICIHTTDGGMGACYGTLGNNLPSPKEMIALCKHHNIRRIRIYNPNPTILEALQGSDISVIVGLGNEDIQGIARDPSLAESWVHNNIVKYRKVKFSCIAVGNEITPAEGDPSASIAPNVPLAMHRIHDALSTAGLPRIKVSTALSMAVIAQSYPPSAGAFQSSFLQSYINPIVQFLVKTNSPFLMNVYPYFAYISDTTNIPLDYALFRSSSTVDDGPHQYHSLFNAMVDAVHAALEKAGGANVRVVVSETGWPSAGGAQTTMANARTYNSKLLKSVKKGTPRRPGRALETYIFDLIDENNKSPELEKHWGIFYANKTSKYHLSFAHKMYQ